MRTITTHIVNPANEKLTIEVLDEPGHGGACHEYRVYLPADTPEDTSNAYDVNFQNGPIAEAGVNGLTHEVLIAILQDRLKSFQAGPYACTENRLALEYLNAAQEQLQSRTKARMARGVEGTHKL